MLLNYNNKWDEKIEIFGIPDGIKQENLEEKVIEITTALHINMKSSDIEACHWLPNNRKNTQGLKRMIVRFVNRKHAEQLLRLRKDLTATIRESIGLSEYKIYTNNNLCPYYWMLGVAASCYMRK